MVDIPFPVNIACVATADPAVGGTCAANTSLNAVVPGAFTRGNRAVVGMDQLQVFDGGPDGAVATQPNTLFAVQGIFVP